MKELRNFPLAESKFEWIRRRQRKYFGIGGAKVYPHGKRRMPIALLMKRTQKILPGFLESHIQKGTHPLLLSDEYQAKCRFFKGMRGGRIYREDYDDYIDVYRAKGSGIKVICVSNFPDKLDRKLFVENFYGKTIAEIHKYEQLEKREKPPAIKVSFPTKATPDDRVLTVGSSGVENARKEWYKKTDCSHITKGGDDFETIMKRWNWDVEYVNFDEKSVRVALVRRYVE